MERRTPSQAPRERCFTRRTLLEGGLWGGFGCALWPVMPPTAAARGGAAADALIHIHLSGGLSHIDTFDPKPMASVEVRGEFKAIGTAIDGERFTEVLSQTAAIADRLAVIRSFTHGEAAHERGTHNMLTGQRPSPVLVYPSMGAVVAQQLGGRNQLPPYVCVPSGGRFRGTGYLSAAHAPFELGSDPGARGYQVRDLSSPKGVDAARRARRRQLLAELDRGFGADVAADAVDASQAFYEQAYALIESPDAREAFRIDAEPVKVRDRYGRTRIGQRLLLARRLAAAGVRYVLVNDDGYDHHASIFPNLRARMRGFDRGFAALIRDLEQQSLLASTLVVITSEFGRTPKVNRNGGRDHWPKAFSVVLAGGGIRGGIVHGATNAIGSEPERDPVSPPDLAATLFTQLGIDPTAKLLSPGDRPIDIVREGRPIEAVLA